MTDLVQIACIAAIPPTVAAVSAVVVGLINHRQGNAIHVLVNSNMTAVKAELETAQTEIKTLRDIVTALGVALVPPPTKMP